ncbi:Uncharacterised protein [Phocoenobacter uteri]|uniref:Uncharacterized protein n=1 Tax=Phocoenobacter uteri TaxID=146806 RepID=A0A379C8X2_9PAST|nr:hypothetical protein [Phocoenobacter uteri]MDG6882458.1 hypothetical protein [Phocoenobacter uteri]SUB58619.1 Uncharacterised protein [Phocoenobacter uteri]
MKDSQYKRGKISWNWTFTLSTLYTGSILVYFRVSDTVTHGVTYIFADYTQYTDIIFIALTIGILDNNDVLKEGKWTKYLLPRPRPMAICWMIFFWSTYLVSVFKSYYM